MAEIAPKVNAIPTHRCSFCGIDNIQSKGSMIAGEGVSICQECVFICVEIVFKDNADRRGDEGNG